MLRSRRQVVTKSKYPRESSSRNKDTLDPLAGGKFDHPWGSAGSPGLTSLYAGSGFGQPGPGLGWGGEAGGVRGVLRGRPEVGKFFLQIVKILFKDIQDRLAQQNVELQATDFAFEELARLGYDPQFGARPLKRVMQKEVLCQLLQAAGVTRVVHEFGARLDDGSAIVHLQGAGTRGRQ